MTQNFDDIWFTCKARIAAELRLKNTDTHSQVLLVWYAITSSLISVIGLKYKDFLGSDTDIFTAVLSLILLVISMLVTARDYKGRSMSMRANHIALKLLLDQLKAGNVKPQQKPELYSDLLSKCENHSSYDDRYFRIFANTNRPPKCLDILLVGIQATLRWSIILSLYVLPVLIVVFNFPN